MPARGVAGPVPAPPVRSRCGMKASAAKGYAKPRREHGDRGRGEAGAGAASAAAVRKRHNGRGGGASAGAESL